MKEKIDQIIEHALKVEPSFKLGVDFKDKVLREIRRRERVSQRKFYLLMTFGVFIMVVAGLSTWIYFGGNLESFSGFSNIIPMAVLMGSIVVLVQYLDRKLVKDRFFKQPV